MTTIDVIIAVYNNGPYVGETIESVLTQKTRHRLLLTVVDDGSTDDSAQVVKGFGDRVQLHSRPHAGIGATKNYAIAATRERFIAFVDADDLWETDKVELQMEPLLDDETLDATFSMAVQFASPDVDPKILANRKIIETPHILPLVSNMIIRRSSLGRFEPFADTSLGVDIDWMMKARHLGLKGRNIEKVLMHRRIHAANNSVMLRSERRGYAQSLKALLDLKRKSGVAEDQ